MRRSGLSAAARNLSPTWTMGENFPPEAAQESFPTKRRSLSPRSLMSQILNGEDEPIHRRLRGRAPPLRLSGRRAVETFVPVTAAQPLTMFKPSRALPERQSKEDAAIAMETARPIMWFGEDGQEERWSPFSWSPKPITRAGEFSPRRAGCGLVEGNPRSHSPAGPKSPTVYGIEGRSHRKGLCSPRDVRCSVFEADSTDYNLKRGKLQVKTAPPTGGMSAALQWRG